MESLSDFIANAFEFLVGGLLVILALIICLQQFYAPAEFFGDMIALTELLDSTVVAFALVPFTYAVGVVAESAARSLFEPLLERVTVRNPEFRREQSYWDQIVTKAEPSEGAPPGTFVQKYLALKGALRTRHQRARGILLGPEYTLEEMKRACAERERQRLAVMRTHQNLPLHGEIQGQLKRLRIERMFALSMALVAFGYIATAQFGPGLLLAFLTVLSGLLVQGRFHRYCKAIARGYSYLDTKQVPPAAAS